MKIRIWHLTALSLLAPCTTGRVSAQLPVQQNQLPSMRPAVSPYLNLLRGGAPVGLNYYNVVRPQIDFRNSITGLQGQTAAEQQAISSLEGGSPLPATGHVAGFQTQWSYFQTTNRFGGGGFRPGGGQGAGRPQQGQMFGQQQGAFGQQQTQAPPRR